MSIRRAASVSERDRVGPYVLVKAIGAGGSARVDLARIERAYGFQRHVVIKRPLEHLRTDARAAESLRREARLGALLRHPNLVEILDAGVHDGYDYLVLDYVHGASLRTLMQTDEASRVRDVSLDVALTVVRDVARGVHEAHELKDEHGAPLGLVHRDVSPGNVLLGLDGAVKLADFGIAKETRVATLSGSMHGTVTYMAPEQCRGHAFDRRADVFSLGVILYELVTGSRLFWADNDVASLHRVLAGTIPRPRKLRAGIATELEDIIMTAVAHDQDRRFPNARALADTIETFAATHGHLLVARSVAQWTQELLGPRDAPWVGDNTVIDAIPALPATPLEPPVSLVALIESSPSVEALAPTFGPTDATLFDDGPAPRASTQLVATSKTRRPTALAIGALGIVLVVTGVTALALRGNDTSPRPAATETPVGAPSVTPPEAQPSPAEPQPTPPAGSGTDPAAPEVADEDDIEITDPELVVADEPERSRPTRKKVQRGKKRPAKRDASKSTTGSGSAAKTSATKVQWDPTMLMPTDSEKKKR